MGDGYRTVFEVSYFSNGMLLMCLVFLVTGAAVTTAALTGNLRLRRRGGCALAITTVWCLLWDSFTILWLAGILWNGWTYTKVLRDGQCEVVEGMVEVLHLQPAAGHDPGDRIRVGDREFQFSDYGGMLSYRQTVSHGGALRDDTKARLHCWHGRILASVGFRPRSNETSATMTPCVCQHTFG